MRRVPGYIFLLAAVTALVFGCRKDSLSGDSGDPGDEIEFTFRYAVPGMATVQSKSVGVPEVNQSRVDNVNVFVYRVGEDGVERFVYHRQGIELTHSGNTGTFKLRLAKSKSGERYTFDFLFNVGTNQFFSFFAGTQGVSNNTYFVKSGATREEVRNACYGNSPSIAAASSSTLPMWSTFPEPLEITPGTNFPSLHLIRSVVRLDVAVNLDENGVAQGLDNFTLTYFGSRYYPNHVMFMPDPANIDMAGGWKVKAPTQHPVTSVSNSYPTVTGSRLTDQYAYGWMMAYEPQSLATTPNAGMLVIGGTFTDTGETYYYRVTPRDPVTGEQLPLLRNNRYLVHVKSIDGPGYTTAALAYQAPPTDDNIVYDILVYEEGYINHIAFNDRYMLGVSALSQNVLRVDLLVFLQILTDVPTGWKIVSILDEEGATADWITPSATTGVADLTHHITFTHQENTGAPRNAYVTIAAGNLRMEVTITQGGAWYLQTDYNGMQILGDGDSYKVYLWGNLPPSVWVRAASERKAHAGSGQTAGWFDVSREVIKVENAGVVTPAGQLIKDLEILGNTWLTNDIRQVYFQYSLDQGATWVDFREGPQGKGHFRLKSTGRLVSLYNHPDGLLHWTDAMGIVYTYRNNSYFRSVSGPTNDNYNYPHTPTDIIQTGCIVYEEEGYEPTLPKGNWRLPSMDELREMYNFSDHIGDMPLNNGYWSSTEQTISHAGAQALSIYNGSEMAQPDKGNHYYYVRCVYGPPLWTP